MLQPDDPLRPLDPALLDARGGFAWWYVDVVDEAGNGAVLIWSWGLPFLPGDRRARLDGRPPRTGDRPSVNLALYERGRQVAYTLLEVAPERASWAPGAWQLGDCRFVHEEVGGERLLHVRLDLPVPGDDARLTGELELRGPLARLDGAAPEGPPAHAWAPLVGPARCTARFAVGDRPLLALDGSGYHDRNGSACALDELGLDHWTWGRAIVGDTLVIHYLNWPSAPDEAPVHVLATVGPDGLLRVRHGAVARLHGPARTAFGMRWWRRVEVEVDGEVLEITYEPPVDRGPFYLRAQTTATWRGQRARGWAELCEPGRIDLDRHRFLVNMAVDREAGPTSTWLPLFSGPRRDRLARLLRGWARRWA